MDKREPRFTIIEGKNGVLFCLPPDTGVLIVIAFTSLVDALNRAFERIERLETQNQEKTDGLRKNDVH